MLTIVKELEMVLNNKPITYLYSESDLIEPITHKKRLFGRNLLYVNTVSVCNFQSMKSPVELNSLLSKFFCYITWLLYQLIRRDTGRFANEALTSNPIVSSNSLPQEYVTELREFCEIKDRCGCLVKLNIKDVVLVEDENFKRMD